MGEIRTFSLKQMKAFIALFKMRNSLMVRDIAVATRVAHHADKEGFADFMEASVPELY